MAQQMILESMPAEAAPAAAVSFESFRCNSGKRVATIPGSRATSGINYAFSLPTSNPASYVWTVTKTIDNRISKETSTAYYPKRFYNHGPVLTGLPDGCGNALSEYPVPDHHTTVPYKGGKPDAFRAIYAVTTTTKTEGKRTQTIKSPTLCGMVVHPSESGTREFLP
ncbi:hypothetical protein C8Q69DRAFT_501711 [Paecilomyces variotii]|uniref:Uncharacterized protein n=1 Tax=Byssochlamys spectabilis TaxID=264951 RepID=A0A443HJH7_BYSSP|nr:hypothetical protein C8Q69DRAFT_501711 [Paecilomyces variotii]RWQ92000.1 hypothetical protein C8Q69DRAFT_501711 [Paecilomyces variotii]